MRAYTCTYNVHVPWLGTEINELKNDTRLGSNQPG